MSRRGRVFQRVKGRGKPWAFIVDVAPEGAPRKQLMKGGFSTQKAAQEALIDVLSSLHHGTFVKPDRMTFGEYLEQWRKTLKPRGLRPTTIESYERHLRVHVLHRPIATARLQSLSPLQLGALYAELLENGRHDGKGGLSHRTVRFVHGIIHKALSDATRNGLVTRNVAASADVPSHSSAKPPELQVWNAAQLGAFLSSIADDPLFAMWRLAAMTGMRRGEVIGLRWQDVDIESKRVSVRQSVTPVKGLPQVGRVKTDRSQRTIDVDDETVAALKSHRARQAQERLAIGPGYIDNDFVFAKADGSCLNPKRVSEWFERRVARSKQPPIRLHDLRHTHASNLLQAGVNAKVVSERLGHASVSFTLDRYVHALPNTQAGAAQAFANLVDGSSA